MKTVLVPSTRVRACRGERGSALIAAMLMVVVVCGLVVIAHTDSDVGARSSKLNDSQDRSQAAA